MCKCCNKINVRENLTIESRGEPREARTLEIDLATRKDEDAKQVTEETLTSSK